jgi:predicted membrane GTPase involved in stress response
MVEVTQKSIRLRKTILLAQDRLISRREKPSP